MGCWTKILLLQIKDNSYQFRDLDKKSGGQLEARNIWVQFGNGRGDRHGGGVQTDLE